MNGLKTFLALASALFLVEYVPVAPGTEDLVLDEAQRAPDLFSYIQAEVDEKELPGRFILTGSQNFLLLERISQSLAGRCAVLHLLPFSLAELTGRAPVSLDGFGAWAARKLHTPPFGLFELLHSGLYPRIHDKHLAPRDWLAATAPGPQTTTPGP